MDNVPTSSFDATLRAREMLDVKMMPGSLISSRSHKCKQCGE